MLQGSNFGHVEARSSPGLCDPHVFGPSKRQHAIQRTDSDGYLGRLARIRARPQCVTDDPLVSTDIGLHQRTLVIAGRLLPTHAAALGNELQMLVTLRRRGLGRLAQHRARTRRHDDRRIRMARQPPRRKRRLGRTRRHR